MEKIKKKFYESMNNKQTAEFLRDLASGIEEGKLELRGENFALNAVKKVKISFKNQDSMLLVKTKLKGELSTDLEIEFEPDKEDMTPGEDEAPDVPYKSLKKRMKKSLAIIHKNMSDSRFPAEEDVRSFLDDCIAMTGFSGYGDENYPRFLDEVNKMIQAFSLGHEQEFRQSLNGVVRLMQDCHDRYK
jgi:XXXCH domain-containing protein